MPAPNPYTFPLVPYPGLAPELATRSGMGGWDAYGLAAPSDRLLPFVLSRRLLPSNAPWVNCAWVEHADTQQRYATLVPTGAQAAPATVPALGLVLSKLRDTLNLTEYFTYSGALVPGLADALPCGVPLRLVVDNMYQSPRFFAVGLAADLAVSHLLLEWYHDGPLQGVPYGRGLRQRYYVPNGSLQFLDPRVEQETTKDPNGGADRLDGLSVFEQRAFVEALVPAYLATALAAARLTKYFLADGEPWRLLSTKATASGNDGGRWSLSATLENETPLLRRGCLTPALEVEAYDPAADAPRGWRCGDTSDTAPDFLPTGAYSCQVSSGVNTGYLLETLRDMNPRSPSYNQTTQQVSTSQDLDRCPVPVTYHSAEQTVYAAKNDCGASFTGSVVPFVVPAGAYTSAESQDDADAQALAYGNSQKQANANAQGTCSARQVHLANVQPKIKAVVFDLVRTDAAGNLTVTVQASAEVDGTNGASTQQFTKDFVLPSGISSATGLSLDYGGQVLVSFDSLQIEAASPGDYSY